MEVLSPRSANVPSKSRSDMKKPTKEEAKPKPQEKPSNPDRIDERWRPPPTVTEPGQDAETYAVGKKLGKGGFAVCFHGTSVKDDKVYALKVVKAKVEQKKMMEKFRTELQIHAKMQHPNIVEFLRAFTHDNHTYVVLELCDNGNLTDMVKARGCLSLPEVRRFMIQICGGVRYMHKRSVIHRDLKMGNIFLDSRMNLKIGDFGLAAVMADENDRRTTLCGTPNYIAPEILSKSGTRGHDNKVDTWAIGVICYAMLVGTPPFQSKSQQEIYAKLRTLEYEWKVDCKNYIPQQAKDFVASCLNLNASERPEMDDLVQHGFFTMGAIAEQLDVNCLKHKPSWLQKADPRGDKVVAGYGITHSQMCRDCGVGRAADGQPRPGVGGKNSISTLVEIEVENRQGSAPVIPLPEGILYKAFSEAHAEWVLRQQHPLLPAKPRSRKPPTQATNQESVQILDDKMGPPSMKVPTASSIPQSKTSVPSFAAQQRQQALPSRPAARSRPELESAPSKEPAETTSRPPSAEGLLKARPMRTASVRVTRSASAQTTTNSSSSRTLPKSTTLPSLAEAAGSQIDRKGVIDRTSKAATVRERPKSRTAFQENATLRPKSSFSAESKDYRDRVLQPTTANDRRPRLVDNIEPLPSSEGGLKEQAHLPFQTAKQAARLIALTDSYSLIKDSTDAQVLRSLRSLEMALSQQSSGARSLTSRRTKTRSPYPRVDKWVDYSSRHGIAYILTDGTLGMIMKSSDDNSRPSSCVVVRNAKQHTINRAKGTEQQLIPQGTSVRDVEFFEQTDAARQMKKLAVPASAFCLDMSKASSASEAASLAQSKLKGSELERFKNVGLLDKFGKYMNKRVDDTETDPVDTCESGDHFIHFYQRLGNVGVWRFSDGGLQFNFPDHTKVTIYPDPAGVGEFFVDLVHLDVDDAKQLAKFGRLTSESLERRSLLTLSLSEVLSDSLRSNEMEIIAANEIKEKLSWIRAVAGCWLKEGGLGRMGEEKLGWMGLRERRDNKKVKLQWVTVGRLGGDGEGVGSKES
jgi:hypothetical protein